MAHLKPGDPLVKLGSHMPLPLIRTKAARLRSLTLTAHLCRAHPWNPESLAVTRPAHACNRRGQRVAAALDPPGNVGSPAAANLHGGHFGFGACQCAGDP